MGEGNAIAELHHLRLLEMHITIAINVHTITNFRITTIPKYIIGGAAVS